MSWGSPKSLMSRDKQICKGFSNSLLYMCAWVVRNFGNFHSLFGEEESLGFGFWAVKKHGA